MRRLFVVFSGLALATPAFAASTDWELDAAHSHVGFVTKHLAITKVRGEFQQFDAKVKADDKTGKIDALEATAKTASVNTGNANRDKHLKSDDFFAADKYPELKLKLKSIKWEGNNFTAETDLTIRGVTKPVTFKGEQSAVQKVNFGGGPRLTTGYSASATINRKDFGLSWSKVIEAVPVASDEVTIELEIEMGRKAG